MGSRINKEEFAQMVRQHGAAVIDFTARLLSDRSEAEDVAQDAFVKAFRQLSSFRGDASLLTWVQRIAYREAISHLRRRRPYTVDISEIAVTTEDADLSTGCEERIALMEEAVGELHPDDQLLLHLYYYEDRPLREIAYVMDAEPNTLSQRLRRIRKRLLRMIKKKDEQF